MVPVRMGVRSSIRREDQVAVAILEIHYRVDPDLAGAGASVIDEYYGRALEVAAYLSPVFAELLNDASVPVVHSVRQPLLQKEELLTICIEKLATSTETLISGLFDFVQSNALHDMQRETAPQHA